MIKVKITEVGGYIVGDGAVPEGFNPDMFMQMFIERIYDAKCKGLEELDIPEEEMQEAIAALNIAKQETLDILDEKYTQEYADDDFDSAQALIESVI